MALPKVNKAEFPITFPLSGFKTSYRQYTIHDEKLLLQAAANRDSNPQFYVDNTLKVVRDCIVDKTLLSKLASVDVEYLLLQIRAKSVGEVVELKYKDPETNKTQEVELNLEKFFVDQNSEHSYDIKITDTIGIKMRDLRFEKKIEYGAKFNDSNRTDVVYETIVDCIELIYDGDTVYVADKDMTRAELKEWVEGLSGVSEELYKFVMTMPQLAIEFTLIDGTTKKLVGSEIDFLALSPTTST